MGKRARARGTAAPRAKQPAAPRGVAGLDPVRRTLTAYLVGALLIAIVCLVGILVLGGTLGPSITLGVVLLAAGLLSREASRRLAGATLSNEDRMMQTLAGGMLFLAVVLAAAGVVVAAVA